jgi:hypothetical protein
MSIAPKFFASPLTLGRFSKIFSIEKLVGFFTDFKKPTILMRYEPKTRLDLIISISYTYFSFILYQYSSFFSILFNDDVIFNNNVTI